MGGWPCYDDQMLFEFLILEGAQAGLNWLTVLKKRESYRQAFCQFSVGKVARFSSGDIEMLIQNKGIIRNRLKIISAIKNAQVFIELQAHYDGFHRFLWGFCR